MAGLTPDGQGRPPGVGRAGLARRCVAAGGFGFATALVVAVGLPASPVPAAVQDAVLAAPMAPQPSPVVVEFALGAQERAQAQRGGPLALPIGTTTAAGGGSLGPAPASQPYGRRDTSGLTASGIPVRVAKAYQAAAATTARTDPSCRLNWTVLAGIGRVETDHGRFGGSAVRADGVVTPSILGIRLDGVRPGTARISDSDGGRLDGDAAFDRAVGPMQFLPGTWRTAGADGDGDGRANPQDVDDAALAAARYLCAGGADLGTTTGRWSAVLRYNHSDSYVATVLALADAYASGHVATFPTRPAAVPEPRRDDPAASPVREDPPPSLPAAPASPVTPTGPATPPPSPPPPATGTPTPTSSGPTATPTGSPTTSPTTTPTTSPTGTPTTSPTGSPTCPTATPTGTPSATATPTATPTASPDPCATATTTAAPTAIPSATATPTR